MESFDWYSWVILPVIIFFARLTDVTLGTMRIIFTSRGKRNLAPFLGFVEVFIWIVVIGQIVRNLDSVTSFIGYAAGFAVGTFVGMLIEERMAIGTLILRIIVPNGGCELADRLRADGFGVTIVDGQGASGGVKILYTIIKRKDYKCVAGIIHEIHPGAFMTVEEVRSAEMGIFPKSPASTGLVFGRKSK